MHNKKYDKSNKRIMADYRRANWEKRIEMLTLYNQGWTVRQLAKKYDISTQAVYNQLEKIKLMTVEEMEKIVIKIKD